MGDDNRYVIILCIGAFLGSIPAAITCGYTVQKNYQKQAIEHNAAHYDPVTSKFTWNDEKQNE